MWGMSWKISGVDDTEKPRTNNISQESGRQRNARERERESKWEETERVRGEKRAKSMTSEAVGAQGCDPTDPTSLPRPPSEPSLALLRAPLPSPLAPGVDGRRAGPFFAPHLTRRPHWLPPSRSDLSSLDCRWHHRGGRPRSFHLGPSSGERKNRRPKRSGWNANRLSIDRRVVL